MDDAVSTLEPALSARLAELEALVAAQRAALDEERAARANAEAERDRLREAYEALTREVELARRRLVVAKAERVDTTQLELEFAAKLAELDKLSRKAEEEIGEKPERERKKKPQRRGRRDLRLLDLPEERLEIPDPLLDGKAARIGTEDSVELRWKRGGFVRLVFARIKYDATKPATTAAIATPTTATPAETRVDTAASSTAPVSTTTCTREALASLVASDPRTAGAVIVTAPMPPRLIERSYATPSLLAHVASDKFCDGLPLHRQEDRFARLGVPIDRGTMCRWLEEVGATAGATIVEAMRKDALATAHCIATDATGIRVQPVPRKDKQSQPCRPAHFFVQIADADYVFFEFTPEETSAVVHRLFAGYTGFVQAYVQFGCTAHSSRGGAICTNAATVSERKINEALLETLANETLSIPNVMKEFAEQFENRASEKIEKGPGDLERELRAAENRVTSATRLMVEMPDDLDLRRQREADQNEVRRLKDAIAAQTGAAASGIPSRKAISDSARQLLAAIATAAPEKPGRPWPRSWRRSS